MRTTSLAKSFLSIGVLLTLAFAIAAPFSADAAATLVPPSNSQGGASGGSSTGCDNLKDRGLNGVVGCIIGLFNTLIYLMMSASVLFVVYGAFLMIASEEKRDDGKKIIYHGIIGLFVMISIWGLVNILDSTFNLSSVSSNQVIPSGGFIAPR